MSFSIIITILFVIIKHKKKQNSITEGGAKAWYPKTIGNFF